MTILWETLSLDELELTVPGVSISGDVIDGKLLSVLFTDENGNMLRIDNTFNGLALRIPKLPEVSTDEPDSD